MNKGDPANPHRPELGEFHPGMGGYIEFGRYGPGHPYEQMKDGIKRNFFDVAALEGVLGVPVADPVFEELGPPGTIMSWYAGPLHYEWFRLNGAEVVLKWSLERVAANPDPHLFILLGSGQGPHSGPQSLEPADDLMPDSHWEDEPLTPHQQATAAGNYHVILLQNRWPDFWVALQRVQDLERYLRARGDLTFGKVFVEGGSWEATEATRVALLAPKWCHGVVQVGFPDIGYESGHGGWGKLLMTFYSALGSVGQGTLVPVPPRTHSIWAYTFSLPTLRAAELSGGWEHAAFSILRRKDLGAEALHRPLHGNVGNCDVWFNIHWFRDICRNDPNLTGLTTHLKFLQLAGHDLGQAHKDTNRISAYSECEVYDLVNDQATNDVLPNPPIEPSTAAPDDPYSVQVYDHTLRENLDFLQVDWKPSYVASPLLTVEDWNPDPLWEPDTLGPIGNGIFPGAFDSLRVGDFDLDGFVEVVFGNMDGFVEVLEESIVAGEPILVPEYRSPPMGWGIQALDVDILTPNQRGIVFATSAGVLYKIAVTGPDSYSEPVPFVAQGQNVDLGGGFLEWLFIADFAFGYDGNEVLVENQFGEWFLFLATGTFLAKTEREPFGDGTPDNFASGSGKPWVGYWPPRTPTSAELAMVPGMDGFLRRLHYQAGQGLVMTVVSPDTHAMGRCAHMFDPPGTCGPYVVVGGKPGYADRDDPQDDGWILTVINPATKAVVGHSHFDVSSGIGNPITLEPYDTNEILVVSGGKVGRARVDWSGGCSQVSIYLDGPGVPYQQAIPGAAADIEPTWESLVYGSAVELCGAEKYTSLDQTVRYVVASPNGRLWILNHADLSYARTTGTLELPPGGTAKPWYSNRSFGHTYRMDQYLATGDVWVDDLGLVYYGDGANNGYRLVHLKPGAGQIDDYARDGLPASWTNTLGMRIHQATGEPIPFVETGDVATIEGVFHRYCLTGPVPPTNGFIQRLSPGPPAILQNFDVPIDETVNTDFGNEQAWPYMSEPRYHGQVSTSSPFSQRTFGNSVRIAFLPKGTETEWLHVVVGTLGGFVYAADPTAPSPDGLTYDSRDLGWAVIGLDIGDLDGDGKNEILAGTWLDTGGLDELENLLRNRGQLTLLRPPATGHEFEAQTIDLTLADEDPGPFGAGVFGIRIDDIDGDDAAGGYPEIWVTDARGYLHALWFNPLTQRWECFYRTRGLGMYAGIYNKIYPYREWNEQLQRLQTTWLVVETPGYVYRFQVHPEVVPHGNP
ncbi:MAG: hypothetical protein AB1486_31810 [Planctomycetota bacterium]